MLTIIAFFKSIIMQYAFCLYISQIFKKRNAVEARQKLILQQ